MWIRSQCKDGIANVNAIWYDGTTHQKDGIYIFGMHSGYEFLLGKYSTKEKTLKVLDRIQEHIDEPTYVNGLVNEYACYDKEVFQMPQDDEI